MSPLTSETLLAATFSSPGIEYAKILPILIVLGVAVLGVLVEAFLDRRMRFEVQLILAVAGLVAAFVSVVTLAGDVGVLFLMVVKPTTYLPAILAVAAAQLLMLGFRALTRKSAIAAREPAVPMGG